jgi:TatD DNase family protein
MMSLPYFNLHSHYQDNQNHTIFQASSIQEDCWFSFGIHPWDTNSSNDLKDFKEILNHQNCLALGEIGLDKIKDINLEKQIEIFTSQIELSEELQLPVIIYCVRAWNELKLLKRRLNPTQPWIYHGFSKKNILYEVLEEGMLVSFGQSIMNDLDLLKSSLDVSMNKIFFETDDKQVEIEQIYSTFANAKQITLQELKEIQFENFKRVFKKWKSG